MPCLLNASHAYFMPKLRARVEDDFFYFLAISIGGMRGIGRFLLTLDRGASLIAYGSYLAGLALDYIRIVRRIADWLSMLYRQLL